MSGEYEKLGHPTTKLAAQTEEERREAREAITKVQCPVCRGCGMVIPDVAAAVDLALAMVRDQA